MNELRSLIIKERHVLDFMMANKDVAIKYLSCPSWKFWEKRRLRKQWRKIVWDARLGEETK